MDLDIGAGLQSGASVANGILNTKYQAQIQDDLAQKASDRALSNEERMSAVREMSAQRSAERLEQLRRGGMEHDFGFKTSPSNVQAAGEAEAGLLTAKVGTKGYANAARAEANSKMNTADLASAGNSNANAAQTVAETARLVEITRLQNVIADGQSDPVTIKNAKEKLGIMTVGAGRAGDNQTAIVNIPDADGIIQPHSYNPNSPNPTFTRVTTSGAIDGITRPATEAEYNAMPKGTQFIHPQDGQLRIKQ